MSVNDLAEEHTGHEGWPVDGPRPGSGLRTVRFSGGFAVSPASRFPIRRSGA